jgi:hypothetical protein
MKNNRTQSSANLSALILSVIIILFSSCSIEKRTYMPGYHINWKGHTLSSVKKEEARVSNMSEDRSKTLANLAVEDESSLSFTDSHALKNEKPSLVKHPALFIINKIPVKRLKNSLSSQFNNTDKDAQTISATGSEIQKETKAKAYHMSLLTKVGLGLLLFIIIILVIAALT